MTRVGRVSVVVGLVLALAGCRVDTRVAITVNENGSGTLRSTITVDADAVAQMGGSDSLGRNVPLDDLRLAGWTISKWKKGGAGSDTMSLAHAFANQQELTERVLDLAGPHGILQNATLQRDRGWFSSHDALGIVVDLRSPKLDIVGDKPLAQRLRDAGADPARLEAQLADTLKTALHVSVTVHLPGGETQSYDVGPGKVRTLRAASGGTDWDHVVKFGIGMSLALLAGLFFLAAGVGARRNRRRAAQRLPRPSQPDRAPLM